MYSFCILYAVMPLIVVFSVYEKAALSQWALLVISGFFIFIAYVPIAKPLRHRMAASSGFKKIHSFVCDLLCRFGGVLLLLLSFDQLLLSIAVMLAVVVAIYVTSARSLSVPTNPLE